MRGEGGEILEGEGSEGMCEGRDRRERGTEGRHEGGQEGGGEGKPRPCGHF